MPQTFEVKRSRRVFYVNGQKVRRIIGRSGGYRFVGETADGLIFKADIAEKRDSSFSTQTRDELEAYAKIKDKDLQYFPTILDFGEYDGTKSEGVRKYFWLIEKKVRIVNGIMVSERIAKKLDNLVERYRITDLACTYAGAYLSDSCNWTIVNNKPMIYDFGVQRGYC